METLSRHGSLNFQAPDSRIPVALARLAEETRCPVCFGILKQTVTSTICLHRFCAACINTCLAGRPPQHKECPVCRTNLHSRRALRPDPNFDMLLKALYGDVELYGKQEDALVAANNAVHVQETAEEREHRKALRMAQQAAVAASRPNIHCRPSDCLRTGSNASAAMARQASNGGSTGNDGAGGPSKRPREPSCGPSNGTPSAGHDRGGGGGTADGSPGGHPLEAPGAKRRHSSLLQPQAAAGGEAAALSPRRAHSTQQAWLPPEAAASAAATAAGEHAAGAGRRPMPCRDSLSPPPQQQAACKQQHPHAQQHRPLASPRRSGSGAASAPSACTAGSGPGRGCRTGSAAEYGGLPDELGRGGPGPPRGPLAVPTARSASELSFRHPGMVVVQLQPAHGISGFAGGESGWSEAGGRSHRVLAPALQKPFMMCPVKWTVAHVAQLLSQWLPHRGYGPAAAPVPPSSIRLEPAPGLLRGSHRCLRGCTGLGALASEIQAEEGRERGGGGRGDQPPHLVLLYSVIPS